MNKKMKKAFVIAHYNDLGRVTPDLYRLILYLVEKKCIVILVSTKLCDDHYNILLKDIKVIRRENIGYDFWSYKVGIEALGDLGAYDRVTVFNSSFLILSIPKLCDIFLKDAKIPSVCGLSMSYEKEKHIQSYWVSFESTKLLKSYYFRNWWKKMTPISNREEVINKYEVKMTNYFEKYGVQSKVIYEPTEEEKILGLMRFYSTRKIKIKAERGIFNLNSSEANILNPTHYFWEGLMISCGVIKYELLIRNPQEIPIRNIYKQIESHKQLKLSLELNRKKLN
jgi:lipopolysaccharide biosynthesis protein